MKHEESQIQKSIVTAIRCLYPKSILLAIPNEARRNVRTGAIMKAMGMLSGASDLIFIHKGNVYFFEVKTDKGKQTDTQKEFEKRVIEQGFKYFVIRSANEALNIIVQINTLN